MNCHCRLFQRSIKDCEKDCEKRFRSYARTRRVSYATADDLMMSGNVWVRGERRMPL